MLACSLEQWSTSGVSLATGLTGCVVLLLREFRRRVGDQADSVDQTDPAPHG